MYELPMALVVGRKSVLDEVWAAGPDAPPTPERREHWWRRLARRRTARQRAAVAGAPRHGQAGAPERWSWAGADPVR
ncbi:MAG TPA: hypothetical protein PKB06_09030 [Actinotalea sp.]|nr:hypothetical protein [Actinotalea sp.]